MMTVGSGFSESIDVYKLRDVFPNKNVCFFISLIKGGGRSFPFIKIYVADFV